jgi:hypothetical protein
MRTIMPNLGSEMAIKRMRRVLTNDYSFGRSLADEGLNSENKGIRGTTSSRRIATRGVATRRIRHCWDVAEKGELSFCYAIRDLYS